MSEPRPRRPPKKVTSKWLERVAIHYLQRYTAPSEHLRRVLRRRIRTSVAYHGGTVSEHEPLLDELIERLRRGGFLDDVRWTRSRVEELHRRGASRRAIAGKLSQKGVPRELVDEALSALDGDAELAAARTYARRRRLGPWCVDEAERAEKRPRHLASLARQGFSYDVARRALEPEEG